MNQSTLRSTLSVLGAIIGVAILSSSAWSADTARKGTPKGPQGKVQFQDFHFTKERQQPSGGQASGDTPAGQLMLNNKNPDLTIVSPRDPASGQATGIIGGGSTEKTQEGTTNENARRQEKMGNFEIQGISWSGSDGDDVTDRQKSPTKGQASGKPTGQNATGGTIPVYSNTPQPNGTGSAPTAGIMVCNGGPCFNPVDTSRSTPGNSPSGSGIFSPRDPQSGLPTGN